MYKYQSKCKFRMLTTIGDNIVEIRPKQIIHSTKEIDNPYLVLIVPEEPKRKQNGQNGIKPPKAKT